MRPSRGVPKTVPFIWYDPPPRYAPGRSADDRAAACRPPVPTVGTRATSSARTRVSAIDRRARREGGVTSVSLRSGGHRALADADPGNAVRERLGRQHLPLRVRRIESAEPL